MAMYVFCFARALNRTWPAVVVLLLLEAINGAACHTEFCVGKLTVLASGVKPVWSCGSNEP
jgi:hypothetical protein